MDGRLLEIFEDEGVLYHGALRTESSYLQNHRTSLDYRLKTYGQKKPISSFTALVPTMPCRAAYFAILLDELNRQGIPVIWDDTEQITIGEKRNRLLARVKTPYFTFIDDDDWISHDYGASINRAIKAKPGADYIVFDMLFSLYQAEAKRATCGVEYPGWYDTDELHYRDGMHIMCWRTALARKVPFDSERQWAEDYEWCRTMIQKVKKQTRIKKILYVYEFLLEKSLTRQFQPIPEEYQVESEVKVGASTEQL